MAEENQVQQVTTKDPKKVKAGKRQAKYYRKKREAQKSEVNHDYGIRAVLAARVIGCRGYYFYQNKKGVSPHPQPQPPQPPKINKFEMD